MNISQTNVIKTIEADDHVDYADESSDTDIELAKPQHRKNRKVKSKHKDFAASFTLFSQDGEAAASSLFANVSRPRYDEKLLGVKHKRHRTSLDDKIQKIRKQKQLKSDIDTSNNVDEKSSTDVDDKKSVDVNDNLPDSEGEGNEEEEEDSEAESSEHSDFDVSDVLKTKDRKKKMSDKKLKAKMGNNRDMVHGTQPEEDYFAPYAPSGDQQLVSSFTDMNLSRPIMKAVNEMNFTVPTPIQSVTIPVALQGRDICACAATGTGKTLAFMLPILERLLYRPRHQAVTRVLVLSPTRELAVQIYTVSRELAQHTNIHIALAAGGLDIKSQEVALRTNPDIVVATPGRLIDHLHNAPSFNTHSIEILVLDEADRMLDEYFAQQMKEIIRQCSPTRQTMLFSATMTDQVNELVSVSLKQPVKLFVNSNTQVAFNLRQEFIRIRSNREGDREAILAALLSRTFRDHTIVFLQTKKQTHRLHIVLGLLGVRCGELHGDLSQQQRLEALRMFKDWHTDVLLCTDLAARGLDIEGVKTVINFTLPSTLKHYVHRVGRTARAGQVGRSVSLCGESERKLLRQIVKAAREPVKSRTIPPEVVSRYGERVRGVMRDVERVLLMEKEEKELVNTETQLSRAQRLLQGGGGGASSPHGGQREWFQSQRQNKLDKLNQRLDQQSDKKSSKGEAGSGKKKKQGVGSVTVAADIIKAQQYAARLAKRQRKTPRIRVFNDRNQPGTGGQKAVRNEKKRQKQKKKSSFDNELTNTSRKEVKRLRYSKQLGVDGGKGGQKKSKGKTGGAGGGKFKSKKKFKRR